MGIIYPPFDKEKMPEHYEIRIITLYLGIIIMIVIGIFFLTFEKSPIQASCKQERLRNSPYAEGRWSLD